LRNLLIILFLTIFAIIGRIIPHPPNYTPVLAVGLFCGMLFRSYWLSFAAMFTATFLSDLAIGFYNPPVQLGIYCCLIIPALLGKVYLQLGNYLRTSGVAFLGSFLFYLTSNFLVWSYDQLYPLTLRGLLDCYVMALPFFFTAILADQFYSLALMKVYFLYNSSATNPASLLYQPSKVD
jgi:hypothetical protein